MAEYGRRQEVNGLAGSKIPNSEVPTEMGPEEGKQELERQLSLHLTRLQELIINGESHRFAYPEAWR